jgi:hypothetical protein
MTGLRGLYILDEDAFDLIYGPTFLLSPDAPASGAYTAKLPACAVNTSAGQPLNADYTFQYIFLPGDADQNGTVNTTDFTALAT